MQLRYAASIVRPQFARFASKVAEKMLVYTNEKSGMEGYNKELQLQVVRELSSGSEHQVHAEEKGKLALQKAVAMRKLVQKLKESEIEAGTAVAEELVKQAESTRNLNEWCVTVDMDMFYAAVEQKRDPSLVDHPMVVGTGAMVATANYAARKFGVRSAMPGFIAKELVERQGGTLVFIKPDMARYRAASQEVLAAVRHFGPHFSRSLDEVHINITGIVAKTGNSPAKIARDIRLQIERKTGLTASAGVGRNWLLSKMASQVNKPNAQYVTPGTKKGIQRWMASQDIRKIPGVGPVSEVMYRTGFNIHTAGDVLDMKGVLLAAMPTRKKSLSTLFSTCLGISDTRVSKSKKHTVGTERTFAALSGNETSILKAVSSVARAAHATLPPRCHVMQVCLRIKFSDFSNASKSMNLGGLAKARAGSRTPKPVEVQRIINAAKELYLEVVSEHGPRSVRLIGVRFKLADEDKGKKKGK